MNICGSTKNKLVLILVLFGLGLLLELLRVQNFTDNIFYELNQRSLDKHLTNYVLFECVEFCGGWADRLKGIYSAYLWSLLTDRNFRINITHPCYLTSLVKPNKIPWDSPITKHGIDIQKIPGFTSIQLNHIDDKKFQQSLEFLDITKIESDKNLIVIANNFDWTIQFSKNPLLTQKIHSLGYKDQHKFNLVHQFKDWYSSMFKLSNPLQVKYNQVLRQLGNNKLICAQIRIGGARPNVKFDFQFNSLNVTTLFWDFINKNFVPKINAEYKVFISTDHELVNQEAEKMFGKEKMIHIPGLFTHIDREKNLKENCERVDKTVLDFQFIENCDYVIISRSGYGMLSVLRRNDPYENAFMFNDNKFNVLTQEYLLDKLS